MSTNPSRLNQLFKIQVFVNDDFFYCLKLLTSSWYYCLENFLENKSIQIWNIIVKNYVKVTVEKVVNNLLTDFVTIEYSAKGIAD